MNEPDFEDEQRDRRPEDPDAQAKYEARVAKRAKAEANRDRLRQEARAAIERSGRPTEVVPAPANRRLSRTRTPLHPRRLPDPKRQLIDLLGESRGKRSWRDLNAAAEHLDAGRAPDAEALTKDLYKAAGEVLEVAELHGLALYSLGEWDEAIEVLEEVRANTGLPDQNPVLADAHRAVGNYKDVAWLWEELRENSPASAVMNEGRIVAAGALADQGDVGAAVRLLSKGWKRPKRPFEHHLRRAYALADLYERAGEGPRAQELFGWIAHHEPKWLDAAQRSSKS